MLNCHLHDYVEVACLYRLMIRVTLKQGDIVEGTAKNVKINDARQECLLIEKAGEDYLFILDEIKSMQALQQNSHFDLVEFEEA